MPTPQSVSEIIEKFSDQPIVDAEQIGMLEMVDEESEEGGGLVAELFGLFKDESGGKLDELSDICAENDVASFRKIVHFIAGSAGNIGLLRLNLALRAVEEAIDDGNITELNGAEAAVRATFNESCKYMVANHNV